MKIDKLDEFQGLTVDMVREWLEIHGWEVRECGNGSTDAKKRFTYRVSVLRCAWDSCLGWLLTRVAAAERMSVQALLREINPRMREGVPSEAARQAHPGNWLVSGCLNQSKEKHFEVWHSRNLHLASNYPYNPDGKRIECWPLDEHGSKVRWPTDSEGKML